MGSWFTRYESFVAPFGIALFAAYLWSMGGQQSVTFEYAASLVGIGTLIFGALYTCLRWICNVLLMSDYRKHAEEQALQEAKVRQEFIETVRREVYHSQRTANMELLAELERGPLVGGILSDNAGIKERLERVEAALGIGVPGEDN